MEDGYSYLLHMVWVLSQKHCILPVRSLVVDYYYHSIRGKSEPDERLSLVSGSAPLAECGSASFHFRSLYEGGGVPVSSSTVAKLRRD